MVIEHVDIGRVTGFESEDDALVARYIDRPESGVLAFQRMQPPARYVHALDADCGIQLFQDAFDPIPMLSRDVARIIASCRQRSPRWRIRPIIDQGYADLWLLRGRCAIL